MLSARSQCQEAIRKSLANEQGAGAQIIDPISSYRNVQAGLLDLRLEGERGIGLSINIDYSRTHPGANPGCGQNLNLKTIWPVTEPNTFALPGCAGYGEQILEPALSLQNIPSDSDLAFYVDHGNSVYGLHDRFSAVDCHAGPRR